MNEHPLTGIDPAVVHMAVKAPNHAPVELKATIAKAARFVIGGGKKPLVSLDGLLAIIRGMAKENGYDLVYSTGEKPQEQTFQFQMMKKIMQEVADKHEISVHEIKSASRKRVIIPARHEFFYRAKTETLKSYPDIGRFCGGRDHTTVLHGVQKYALLNDRPMPGEKS
ncbi:helix-turn-helix domain-containing protein [Roseibium album]|uniref:helix-turn-helix domain-containing protein n=1 Tax=Roseibium album TaxID=311410 RepID=UPI003BAE4B58